MRTVVIDEVEAGGVESETRQLSLQTEVAKQPRDSIGTPFCYPVPSIAV